MWNRHLNKKHLISISVLLGAGCILTCEPTPIEPNWAGLQPQIVICEACREDTPENPLVPLEIGYYWTYEYTEYDSAGNVISVDHEFICRVVKDRDWLGQKWYFMAYQCFDPECHSYSYLLVRNSQAGYCVGADKQVALMQYKYPVQVDESYCDRLEGPCSGQSFALVSDTASIEVPAGTFECLLYLGIVASDSLNNAVVSYRAPGCPLYGATTTKKYSTLHYVVPGVGVVRTDVRALGTHQYLMQRWELKQTNVP
ncbi:MAG: hypothetical protein ABII79_06620 [bacterium]